MGICLLGFDLCAFEFNSLYISDNKSCNTKQFEYQKEVNYGKMCLQPKISLSIA